jgi:hypothetical protein
LTSATVASFSGNCAGNCLKLRLRMTRQRGRIVRWNKAELSYLIAQQQPEKPVALLDLGGQLM